MNDRRDQELAIRESHSGSCSSRIYLPYLSLKAAAILQGQNRKFKFFLIKPALFFLFVKNLSTYPPPQEDIKGCFNNIFIVPDRYGNAILTDNLEWRFWRAGDTEMYTGLRIMELVNGELILRKDNIELFFSLLEDFLLRDPAQIKSSTKLAEYMAMHARTIRSIISGILKDDGNGQPLLNDSQKKLPMFMELYGLYSRIKSDLRPLMNTREFADMYAQTIVYGLFIARYNDTSNRYNRR